MSQATNADLHSEIRRTSRQTNETLKGISRALEDTKSVASACLQQLDEQNNQLHSIEAGVDNLAADITEADKQADKLSKGWFKRLTAFKKYKKDKQEQRAYKAPRQGSTSHSGNKKSAGSALSSWQDPSAANLEVAHFRASGNGELEQELQGYNKEFNSHLESISGTMDMMKEMSLAIGDRLDESAGAIGRVAAKTEDNQSNLKQANFKLSSMVK